MKQQLLETIQVTVWIHSVAFIFICFYQTENGPPKPLLRRQKWVILTGGGGAIT